MSESSAAKKKKKTSVEDFINSQGAKKKAAKVEEKVEEKLDDSAFANIEENAFYKIMLDEAKSPEEKKEAVAKALTFTDNKEEAKQNLEEFNKFKEYLQFERKRMAQEIIALTDTEAFGELKQVFEDINTALLTFEDKIGPLTDIVDAVYTLRMNGMTFDVFQELLNDREEEKRRAAEKEAKEAELNRVEAQIKELRQKNARLSEDKKFFGLGGTKKTALQDIAANEVTLEDYNKNLTNLASEIKELSNAGPADTKFADFAEEKAKLKQLLDITSEEHKERQEDLVNSAQDFINTTETRVSSVLGHFDGMNGQIENLDNANYTMRTMYAVLNDATKEANEANEKRRAEVKAAAEAAESDVARLTQDKLDRDINGHISNLGRSNVDTTSVFAELTSSGHRIQSMKEANEQQVAKTRQLHTSGVAGVADQLSTVLQAVSAAALGESSEAAKMSLERMNTTTSELGQKEVIRVALGTKEVNEDLSKALEDLSQYGETIKTATSITREGLTETKDLLGKLEETTAETQAAVKESLDVAADVTAGKGGVGKDAKSDNASANKPKAAPKSPFNLGGPK